MFINKIDGISKLGFKGYQHVKNDIGETVMKFNYPYDYENEDCEVQFFKTQKDDKFNYKVVETPIASVKLKPEGVKVNLQNITNLDKDEAFAYKIVRKNKQGEVVWEGADTGVKIYGGKYSLVSRAGTTPTTQGAGYLAIPDSFAPGVMYRGFNDENTGEIYYDKDHQKKMEGTIRNFSNILGGSIAGLEEKIPYLKENGYKLIFTTPIANGDDVSSHSYWNKNNLQLASRMGTMENYSTFMKKLYQNGMVYVNDDTLTSEGLEGIHFQYALRWAEKNPQSYYWFRMSGLKDSSLGLGVIPKNFEDLRFRFVNEPYKYVENSDGTYKKIGNDNYDSKKPTYCQIYDAKQASERQIKDYDNAFRNYENITNGKEIDINTHDDTLISYVFPIRDFKECNKNLDVINNLNKKEGKNIKLDSAEGARLMLQFSNFRIDKKTEGGFVAWDANTDMVKMNYHLSGYDEKLLQAIVDPSEREHERKLMERGTFEVRDMAIQAGVYWTQKVKDIQTLYSAQTVGNAKTTQDINKLIEEGKLPAETVLSDAALGNILNGMYMLEPKGILDKDSVTVKALMKMPLDAIELHENTAGVLSTSYFSNRATNEETLGLSRYDLLKQKNPHLVEPYSDTYNKVNALFENEIKEFADSIIEKVNETSSEKLLDKDGDYTEYGEYVMELIGADITRYAIFKALAGEGFKTKILKNGEMTYDYESIKNSTSLQALGIKEHSPLDEANALERKLFKGLKGLTSEDIAYVAKSINQRIAGTDTFSFRIAEAQVAKAGKALAHRLDAAKDVMDQDAVRNEDNAFDETQVQMIDFWKRWVQGVKSVDSNSYTIAEITDIPDLMKDNYGQEAHFWDDTFEDKIFKGNPDFLSKLYNETGITSEAGYSYFYTDLLKLFSAEFEEGKWISDNHDSFLGRLEELLRTRSIDYMRNLYTFLGNHDKPRLIHGLATDMRLFHSSLLNDCKDFGIEHDQRMEAIRVLSGAKTMKDVPIELRLNADDNNYFRTLSGRAIAQSKLLMDSVYEDLDGIASEEDKKLIVKALVDLASGNYLGEGSTEKLTKIKIKELSSLEDAFGAILKMAENHGLKLDEAERSRLINQVAEKANNMDLAKYFVHGDFDWTSLNDKDRKANAEHAKDVLGDSFDPSKHSLYTVQLAKLLKDAYTESGNIASKDAIFAGIKDFAQKYDRNTINANREGFKKFEDERFASMKNAYAARDIRTAMAMAIKQAEFTSGRKIENKEAIIDTVFKSTTEPAAQKASMIMEFLKALCGNSAMFAGDEFGMSGYEEKTKNVYLQNRNALPWSQLEENSINGKYRKNIMNSMNGALKDRSNPELHALNDGTPYLLDVQADGKTRNEIYKRLDEINKELEKIGNTNLSLKEALEKEHRELSKNLAKIAYMMHSANGDMTVSLFNAGDVKHGNRVNYFKEYGLDTEAKRKKFFEENNIDSINPNNPYVPILPKSEMDAIILGAGVAIPLGTVFTNANARDKAKYVVKKIGNNLGIVREGGGKIVMDGLTSKNGVMILKHIKNIIFKGAPKKKVYYNAQYNFASNPYKAVETPVNGEKLSIVAR